MSGPLVENLRVEHRHGPDVDTATQPALRLVSRSSGLVYEGQGRSTTAQRPN